MLLSRIIAISAGGCYALLEILMAGQSPFLMRDREYEEPDRYRSGLLPYRLPEADDISFVVLDYLHLPDSPDLILRHHELIIKKERMKASQSEATDREVRIALVAICSVTGAGDPDFVISPHGLS